MRDPADMPELDENLTAQFVNFVGDSLPARHLLRGEDTGGEKVALPLLRYLSPLSDEQTCTGSLTVVFSGTSIRHRVLGP
ncbi:hypothetical protein D3C80_1233200 [compost metagenome]